MPQPPLSTLFALIAVLLLRSVTAHLDVCVDPRNQNIDPNGCTPKERIVHIPNFGANINHALHDFLWTTVHYLLNCVARSDTIVLNEPKQDVSLCTADEDTYKNSTNPPQWSVCVFDIVTRKLNLTYTFYPTNHRAWPAGTLQFPTRTSCTRRTMLGVKPRTYGSDGFGIQFSHYRGMNYFSRECGGGVTCKGSTLVPLADWEKRSALDTIRQSVREFLVIPPRNGTAPVRVLLYDRGDASRRRWSNSSPVYGKLQQDPRVEVRLIRSSPYSMRGQVELYAWADIVIAPHGAAMANTIFMERGTQVMEIWNFCDTNVMRNRFRRKAWTGWHAHLLGINLIYLQCHRADRGFKRPGDLLTSINGVITQGSQKVRIEEMFEYLEPAIKRQVDRLASLRGDTDERGFQLYMNFQSSKMVRFVKLSVFGPRVKYLIGFTLVIFGPLCVILGALSTLGWGSLSTKTSVQE